MGNGYLISRVITPATDPGLITLDDAKLVLGVAESDTSHDDIIQAEINAVSAAISNYCDRLFPKQTYRDQFSQFYWSYAEPLRAQQYPILLDDSTPPIPLLGVTIDGGVLDPTLFEVDLDTGRAFRLNGGWGGTAVVMDYTAGYDPIPADLQAAANEWLTARWLMRGRDPSIRSEAVFDVLTVQYGDPNSGAGATSDGPPAGVRSWLSPYKRWTV
jgi:hypothetical protein